MARLTRRNCYTLEELQSCDHLLRYICAAFWHREALVAPKKAIGVLKNKLSQSYIEVYTYWLCILGSKRPLCLQLFIRSYLKIDEPTLHP
jgi:hypothetical protein